ncbi:ABC transporter ATP-binding protein [candidate division GN15 bacterium]|uniref:ABC transporter ATP-binding protein n=1 Tax=candidate division GN15 bacterium TaxID=2072418 RepID=A0A855WXU3_9BACT|nr:MAG: ABC transporter ATP-binding protein [candidate division GN15 bacterium]
MIELQNVSFSYGEKPVLRDVSFKLEQDESVVIMGPSGSGKSTILRLILGLQCPQYGQVIIDGRNICAMRERDKQEIRKSIGMVFQDGALFDSMTVGENVGYYLIEHTDRTWEEIEGSVRQMLGFVGLDADDIIDKLPEQLSGGMQRRVAIGRALLSTDPKIMLYDEPTTGLDPQSTENVLELINKLTHERSISTIVVTHQIADAFNIADRFIVIHAGEKVFDGNLKELRDSTDERVAGFLAPFRNSFTGVAERDFLNTRH